MRRLAFLFGAGASKGAGGVLPEPPLGSELYERLRLAFPETWGALLTPEEDEAFRSDPPFERGMAMLWETRDAKAQPLIIDLALYFSDFAPSADGSDRYTQLLTSLASSDLLARCVFGTLNYDCVFELAVAQRGIPFFYPGTSSPAGGIPILKPHGSCNFVVHGTENYVNVTMSHMGGYVGGTPQIDALDPRAVRPLYERVGLSLPPVISLYAPGKPSPVADEFVAATRGAWEEAVAAADLAVVIGARPLQADSHIWDPLIGSRADVWYIGGQADDGFAEFSARLGNRLTSLGTRFDEGLTSLAARLRILA